MSELSQQPEEARWKDVLTGEFAMVSAVLAGGVALHAVNITLTSTMLPSIVKDIGGQHLYAWNLALATLAAILSAALTGKLMRRTGVRVAFALAGLIFAAGSLFAACAINMPMLILGRIVQGAGGGMLFTLCYSMIAAIYPQRLWPRAMALLSGTWGSTMLFGPAIGGIFADLGIWRMGYGIMVPVAALYVLLIVKVLPRLERDRSQSEPIAFVQLALLAGAVLAASFGGAASSPIWGVVGIGIALLLIAALMRREQHGARRLFPRGATTLGTPLFLAIAVMSLSVFCVNADFFMPLFLQRLHSLSPLMAGYIAALVSIGWASSEIYSARFTGRQMHLAVLAGPLFILASCLILGFGVSLFASAGVALNLLMAFSLLLLGWGIGIGWPHLNTFILKFTGEDERDQAASALSTVQMFSVAFGTAVAGTVGNLAGLKDTGNTEALANAAFWQFATFSLIAAIAVMASRSLISKQKG